jgi:hypothetical protein
MHEVVIAHGGGVAVTSAKGRSFTPAENTVPISSLSSRPHDRETPYGLQQNASQAEPFVLSVEWKLTHDPMRI